MNFLKSLLKKLEWIALRIGCIWYKHDYRPHKVQYDNGIMDIVFICEFCGKERG